MIGEWDYSGREISEIHHTDKLERGKDESYWSDIYREVTLGFQAGPYYHNECCYQNPLRPQCNFRSAMLVFGCEKYVVKNKH